MSLAGELKDFNRNFQAAYRTTKPTAQDRLVDAKIKESQDEQDRQNQAYQDGISRASQSPIRIAGAGGDDEGGGGGGDAGNSGSRGGDKYARAIPTGDSAKVESQFIGALKEGGLTNPYGLAAMAAYGQHESGYSPGNVNRSWSDPSESGQAGQSGGLLSWRADRYTNMLKATKGAENPVVAQAKFALTENPDLTAALQKAKTPEEANSLMARAWKFAGWNRQGGENAARLAATKRYLGQFQGSGGGARVQQASMKSADAPATPQGVTANGGAIPSMTQAPAYGGSAIPSMTPATQAQSVGQQASADVPVDENGDPIETAIPTTYAATGGLVEDPTDDEAEPAQAAYTEAETPDVETTGAITLSPRGPAGAPGVRSTEPDGPGDYDPRAVARPNRNALEAGVDWIKRTFFPDDDQGALRTAQTEAHDGERHRAFHRNLFAMTPEEQGVVNDTVDPKGQLSPTERRLAGMNGLYEYFMNKGDVKSAQRYAGAMLMTAKREVATMGYQAEAAYEKGDYRTMTKAIEAGMDAWPDGRKVQFGRPTKDGIPYKMIGEDGELTEQGLAKANQLIGIATGMQNGTAVLNQMAGVLKGKSAAEFRKEREAKASQAADDAALEADAALNPAMDYATQLKRRADDGDAAAQKALDTFNSSPQAYKKAKQRQFMQAYQQTQKEDMQSRREEAAAEKVRKKEAADAEEALQTKKENAYGNEMETRLQSLAQASQALQAAKTSDDQDPDAIAQAQKAHDEAAGAVHDWLATSPDAPKFGARYRSAAAAALNGQPFSAGKGGGGGASSAGGGTGTGGGRGGSADERADQRAVEARRKAVLGINTDLKAGKIDEATAKARRSAAYADESYNTVARANPQTFDDTELKGIDEQVQSAWTEKRVDPTTKAVQQNPPMNPDDLRRYRRVVVGLMKGNPDLGTDEASRIALRLAHPSTDMGKLYDDDHRVAAPGLPPVLLGRDARQAIQGLQAGYRSQIEEARKAAEAKAKTTSDRQVEVKRADLAVYQARLRKEGVDPSGMDLPTMRKKYREIVSEAVPANPY